MSPDPQQKLERIAQYLSKGQRIAAANVARTLASNNSNDVTLLVSIIDALADALAGMGDSHPRRGRPSRHVVDFDTDYAAATRTAVRQMMLHLAANTYKWIIVARDIVDGRPQTPETLAGFFWTFEGVIVGCEGGTVEEMIGRMARMIKEFPAEALETVKPIAKRELRLYGLLSAQRQGFRTNARRKIAAFYGLSEYQLKRAQ
jgi:hypothetical protein